MEFDSLAATVDSSNGKSPIVFYETAPPLEHISAFNVALQLMPNELTTVGKDDAYDGSENSSQALPVPNIIRSEILKNMGSILLNITAWELQHTYLIDNLLYRPPGELLSCFVWRWNGNVDYDLTAQNLIASDKLSDLDRINMMCTYCLESELKRNYELFEDLRDRIGDEKLFKIDFNFYWYYKMNGNERKMLDDDDDRLCPKFMLNSIVCNSNSRALAYYFRQVLESDEEAAREFCQHKLLLFDSYAVKYLIMSMEEEEKIKLFELIAPSRIIHRFVKNACPHFARQLWNHVKDSMTGEQYVEMLRSTILKIGDKLPKNEYPDWLMELALDIWSSTPSHLKMFAFQYQDASFIFEWKSWFYGERLLLKILTDADANLKRRFWMQEWNQLLFCSRPGFLRRCMFICLRDWQEIRQYECKIRDSTEMLDISLKF